MNPQTNHMSEDLISMLRNFQQRQYSGPMGPHTRFFGDMGFTSIDAVILGEVLDDHYGCKLPFGAFLRELRDRGAEDLTIGELVQFLARHLSPAGGPGRIDGTPACGETETY